MDMTTIEREAKRLMTAHGVGALRFEFDRGKKRIGATHFFNCGTERHPTWIPDKITLSKHFVVQMSEDEILDVVLHEIAHALAGKLAGHGPVWKRHAVKIGAKPDRCKMLPNVKVEASVKAMCQKCGKEVGGMHRLPLVLKVHANCGGSLDWYKNGTLVPLDQMPARYRQAHYNKYGSGTLRDFSDMSQWTIRRVQ